ncbi:hypothetical protein CAL15_02210 [Bordetella genomosp. 13]|uniref:Uncharacterized protein n=1 Tax=Bordetella genomosp. 13 TaxID=463040 RepID=A0A1W6Z7E7_9BORD|nr:hypothetical protein CAL15_02210 [Bordetella genomosp. 13]
MYAYGLTPTMGIIGGLYFFDTLRPAKRVSRQPCAARRRTVHRDMAPVARRQTPCRAKHRRLMQKFATKQLLQGGM